MTNVSTDLDQDYLPTFEEYILESSEYHDEWNLEEEYNKRIKRIMNTYYCSFKTCIIHLSKTECERCHNIFETDSDRCFHHNHLTGAYIGSLCSDCNSLEGFGTKIIKKTIFNKFIKSPLNAFGCLYDTVSKCDSVCFDVGIDIGISIEYTKFGTFGTSNISDNEKPIKVFYLICRLIMYCYVNNYDFEDMIKFVNTNIYEEIDRYSLFNSPEEYISNQNIKSFCSFETYSNISRTFNETVFIEEIAIIDSSMQNI